MNKLSFRTAEPADLQKMQQLFVETVSHVCCKDYTDEQIHAWTSGADRTQRWQERFGDQFVLLATIDEQIVGFGTLKDGSYIDMFFVHKDFQRQGIALQTYQQLELKAKELGSDHMTADVSITARPFFEKMGFRVVEQQKVERLGIELVNYKMRKGIVNG